MHRKDEPRTLGACSRDRQKPTSKHGAGAAGLGSRAQLTARWEHAYLRLPGEGRRLWGSPTALTELRLWFSFPSWAGWGLELAPTGTPRSPGWMLPSLLCFRCPQPRAGNKYPRSPGLCVCAGGGSPAFLPKKSLFAAAGRCLEHSRDPFFQLLFFFPPTHLQSQGSQLQSASPTPAGKPGCARTSPGCSRSWLQFHPPPPTGAGTHNDQVSLGTRCAVPPSPLPARAGEELGSSQNAACPVGRAPRAPGRWQEPGSACPSTHPAPSASANARTHTPSLPR